MSQSPKGAYGAVSVGTSATLIVAARGTREGVAIQNADTGTLYVGFDSSVTTETGFKIAAGLSEAFNGYQGAVYGVASEAATDVRYQEVF